MKKYYCDICGREILEDDVVKLLFLNIDNEEIGVYDEICDECFRKIYEFIGGLENEV